MTNVRRVRKDQCMEAANMEALANEHLSRKEWSSAAEIYDKILMSRSASMNQVVNCLLGRSECFIQMGQHEAVISDCRKIIKCLENGGEETVGCKFRARTNLIHSLLQLKRYADAELAAREWIASKECPEQNLEVIKLLEKLNATMYQHKDSATINNNMSPKRESQVVLCTYCGLSFPDKIQLRGHCQTEEHQRVIMSDEGREWHWRAPTRGLKSDTYALCESFRDTGKCRYGDQCVEAHGQEELSEWQERFEYRRMKLQRACEKELYGKSYTEELLDKWIESPNPDQIIRDNLDYLNVTCSSEYATTVSSKNSKKEWTFTFTTDRNLCAVALLEDTHRNHFEIKEIIKSEIDKKSTTLTQIEISNRQEWVLKVGETNPNLPKPQLYEYKVTIVFSTGIYGTFRQTAVFDFGSVPVLSRHLCVDVIPAGDVEKVNEIRKEMALSNIERWTPANSQIIYYKNNMGLPNDNVWGNTLLELYPSPQVDKFVLSHSTISDKKVTRTNYKPRMHELLYIEEMARYELIAQYNITTKLRIAHTYLLSPNSMAASTAKYSSSMELFALLYLGKDLSEDTLEGRLVLNSCISVLVAPSKPAVEGTKLKVYEAIIEDKGRNTIYLKLSAETVKELSLVADTEFLAQVQFQLNRIPFCEWHYAIDKIPDCKFLFPETMLEPTVPWSPQRQWCDKVDSCLNVKQREAIVAITTPLYVPLPPVLIIGPFGTGKTFTLAQGILQLCRQSENRILICTHSNSAADLYIKDYLHPHIEAGHSECKLLRIYYKQRWVATVNSVVQQYCLIDHHNGHNTFRMPTIEDITNARVVVVTLSISIHLSSLNLPKGFFTHIFIDEAAQAMESEAICPLALASDNTRIVLAGDHMQMSPEIFSRFARERNLHISLLERLYDHYPMNFPCKILLSENYRAHEAIINFTSEAFYDQRLICRGKQPRHDKFYPLTFFTTRGEDVQDTNSTAFYNNSEVYEIVERVNELVKVWPKTWGPIDAQSIGVMCPYSDQVFRIRSELRKRRLSNISVERVYNVQGKQFRAIFISTVRTRRTCTSSAKVKVNKELDFGFLSNSKLLNTAITRAQSLVAVVGDPIALCSVGKCCKLWEKFIQTCHLNNSLFGITWASLRCQLDGVELKKTYILNPLAPEFIPRKYQMELYMRNVQVLPPTFPLVNPANIPAPQMLPLQSFPMVRPWMPHPNPPSIETFTGQYLYYTNHHPPVGPQPVQLPPQIPAHLMHPRPVHFPNDIRNFPALPPHPAVPVAPPAFIPKPPQHIPEVPAYLMAHQRNVPPSELLNKPDEKGNVQFLNNVHFPEARKPQGMSGNSDVNCSVNDIIGLLPEGMSLAEMIMQSPQTHDQWTIHLLRNLGLEAAQKFQFFIQATTKKSPASIPPTPQPIPEHMHLPNAIKPKEPEQNGVVKKVVPLHQVPLYKRQPVQDMYPEEAAPKEAASGMQRVPFNRQRDNREVDRHWQKQINAEFANLSISNGETIDEMMDKYQQMSYAAVLRAAKPEEPKPPNGPPPPSYGPPRLYKYFS